MSWTDEILGPTMWSEDDEEWHGNYRGHDFALSYDWKREPLPEVVVHAREVLNDPEWILEALERERILAMDKYRKELAGEIGRLRIGRMSFGLQKGKPILEVALLGDNDEMRSWWIAFSGRKCSGIGCDG